MAWQVQEAKQRFSEVLRAAESGEPQIVTRHGREVAVVVDIAEYRRTRRPQQSFVDHLLAAPGILEDDEAEDLYARDRRRYTPSVVFDE
ncbi:MAG: type II toxin-antitoxin system Phd/YefM family antitoxin [Cellulomonadaceae bacterium]|jgi:prevent-host-death family protein|nr:type II toxin-antitoxin system Phd/YefM family antitoxin [Cellulomonadaceae bacterium]